MPRDCWRAPSIWAFVGGPAGVNFPARHQQRRHVVGDVTAGVAVGGQDTVKFLQHDIVSEGFRHLLARRRVLTAHDVDHRDADPIALCGIGGVGQRRIDLGRCQGRRPCGGVWAYHCASAEPPRAAEDRLAERDIAVTATHARSEMRIPLGNGGRAAQTCERRAEQGGSAASRLYEAAHRNASPCWHKDSAPRCGGGHVHPHTILTLSLSKCAFF